MNKIPKKILVFGATSAIAFETVKLFAEHGSSLHLCARNNEELERLANDLSVRGAKEVTTSAFDAFDPPSITSTIDDYLSGNPDLDGLFVFHGLLPEQQLFKTDLELVRKAIEVNFTSVALILTQLYSHFHQKENGTIVVVTSVAGDRGRKSNYLYGSAKAGLNVFLQGLRNSLAEFGVTVITAKPGFVDTPMTKDFRKGLLFVGPEVIARGILRAVVRKKDIVYLPWFWRLIMLVINNIPERIFKRMSI